MAYHQITSGERYTIAALRREGFNLSEIARHLGRHRSTLSREVRRNAARHDGAYRAHGAIERTSARRSRSRRNRQFSPVELAQVEALLRKKWSPEQISGRLRRDGRDAGLRISHETIYRHVWRDKFEGGDLYSCLRQATKLRRKRHNSYDRRGRPSGKRHISERPASVERRRRVGHWEIDTVVGAGEKDCVVTLVERKTGYAVIGKLADRSAGGMARRVTKLIHRHEGRFRTITSDNGTEFHDYAKVEEATDVLFYFATPYHSWERGTNENFNGLLRQYLPKKTSQAHLTQRSCDALASQLNQRPRKRLGYRTPEECFDES
jgi:IS30 family transposase